MLADRTIVITGAANGLGEAWTRGFLDDGATVVAADIDTAGLEPLADAGAITTETDVRDRAAVEEMVDLAVEETGRIDALFNNAGFGIIRPFLDLPVDEFERHVAVHLLGTVYGMHAALPYMREQGYGRIVNTVSRAAAAAPVEMAAYAAAKAGIWATTRSVAAEMANHDILLNMLIPGPTNTSIWGEDHPELQAPAESYPTARMLATLPEDGPTGTVFWDEAEYRLFEPMPDADD